ncbi:hypothetical protein pclt_cds_632 [Pandoravirus celtis]|uniref:DUF5867 domain-containing protein n=1 Tax=Pandoravirus celtis TaxID=2568002 RepID=A0A4D6EHI0_9VIRU|nr:hypothetical protein pclt_cds_632 [Pandoravirus celtis]
MGGWVAAGANPETTRPTKTTQKNAATDFSDLFNTAPSSMDALDTATRLAGPTNGASENGFVDISYGTLDRLMARMAHAKSSQSLPDPLALGGVWWQRKPFSALVERDTNLSWSLPLCLQRAHRIVRAAEKLFCLGTADDPPPPSSVPLKLVYALDDMRSTMHLNGTLADAAAAGDDVAMNHCLDIAMRMASLARAYGGLVDEILERDALRPVSAWLLQAIGALKHARESPLYREARIVAKLAGTDAWLPPLTIACVAGETCSAALLYCARIQAGRAFAQGLCIDMSACDLPRSHSLPLNGRDDSIWVDTLVLVAFARGVGGGRSSAVSVDACADLHRGPMPTLVRGHKSAMDTLNWHSRLNVNRDIIDTVAERLAHALDGHRGTTRDVIAYVLASLVATRWASAGPILPPKKMTVATLKIASILGDLGDHSHAAVLDGLDIGGAEVQHVSRPCPPVAIERFRQSDLLTRLWDHHPFLLVKVLSHVDACDIGSVALASSIHYARIIEALQEDDRKSPRRLSNGVALAGSLWLRQRHDGHPCDPEAEWITPSFDHGPLPGLRPLLFLCRRMPLLMSLPQSDQTEIEAALAMACALGCGAAMTRCGRRLHDIPKLDEPDPFIYDGPPCGAMALLQCSLLDPHDLARHAGLYGSPMLMRVAYTAWPRVVSTGEANIRLMDKTHARLIGGLMDSVVDGIKKGFGRLDGPHADLFLVGLPALVEVICGLLLAVRRDVDAHGPLPHRRAKLAKKLRDAGFAILAPGTRLAMPEARTGLALALFETANRI